jgi:hypothetical protein
MKINNTDMFIYRSNSSLVSDSFRFVASSVFDPNMAFAWLFRPSDLHHSNAFTVHDALNPHRSLMANGSMSQYASEEAIQWEIIGDLGVNGFKLFSPFHGFITLGADGMLNTTRSVGSAVTLLLTTPDPTRFSAPSSGVDYPATGGSPLIRTVTNVTFELACKYHCMREQTCTVVTYRSLQKTCSLYSTTPGSSTSSQPGVKSWTYTNSDTCPYSPLQPYCTSQKSYGPLRIVKQSTRTMALASFGSSEQWMFDRTQPGARAWKLYPVTPGAREFYIINNSTNEALVIDDPAELSVKSEPWDWRSSHTWMLQTTCGSGVTCSLNDQGQMAFCATSHPGLCLSYTGTSVARITVASHAQTGIITSADLLFSVGWDDEDVGCTASRTCVSGFYFNQATGGGDIPVRWRHVHGYTGLQDLGATTECRSACMEHPKCIGFSLCNNGLSCYGVPSLVTGVSNAAMCILAIPSGGALAITSTPAMTPDIYSWVRTDNVRAAVNSLWFSTGISPTTFNSEALCTNEGLYLPAAYGSTYSAFTPTKGMKSTYSRNPISVYHNVFDLFGGNAGLSVYDDSDCLSPDIGPVMMTFHDDGEWYALNNSYLGYVGSSRTDSGGNIVALTDVDYWVLRPTRIKDVFAVFSAHNRFYTLWVDLSVTPPTVTLRNKPHIPTLWKLYTKWTRPNPSDESGFVRFYYQLELYDKPGYFLQATSAGVSLVFFDTLTTTPPSTATVRDEADIPYFRMHNEYLATDVLGANGGLAYQGSSFTRIPFTRSSHGRLQCQAACIRHRDCGSIVLSGANCDLHFGTIALSAWPIEYGGLTWLRPETSSTTIRPRKCYMPYHAHDCAAPAMGMLEIAHDGGTFTIGSVNRWWIVGIQQSEVRFVAIDTTTHDDGRTYRARSSSILGSTDGSTLSVAAFTSTTFDSDTGAYAFLFEGQFSATSAQYRWLANTSKAIQGVSNTYILSTYPSTAGFALTAIVNDYGATLAPSIVSGGRINPSAPESLEITSTIGTAVRMSAYTPGVGACQTKCTQDAACAAIEYLAGAVGTRQGLCRTFAAMHIVVADSDTPRAFTWIRSIDQLDGLPIYSDVSNSDVSIVLRGSGAPNYDTLTGGSGATWNMRSMVETSSHSGVEIGTWRNMYQPERGCSYVRDIFTTSASAGVGCGLTYDNRYLATTITRGVGSAALVRLVFGHYIPNGDLRPMSPTFDTSSQWRVICGGTSGTTSASYGTFVMPEDVEPKQCWFGYGISTGPP